MILDILEETSENLYPFIPVFIFGKTQVSQGLANQADGATLQSIY